MPAYSLKKFLLRHALTYPILIDSSKEVINNYHVTSYPTLYLIDKNSKIIFIANGYSDDLESTLEEVIKSNL